MPQHRPLKKRYCSPFRRNAKLPIIYFIPQKIIMPMYSCTCIHDVPSHSARGCNIHCSRSPFFRTSPLGRIRKREPASRRKQMMSTEAQTVFCHRISTSRHASGGSAERLVGFRKHRPLEAGADNRHTRRTRANTHTHKSKSAGSALHFALVLC